MPSALTAFPKAVEQIIDELEKRTNPYHNKWENSIWLKGVLVLPLNDKLTAKIGKWRIQYSMEFGLSYAKEDDHD